MSPFTASPNTTAISTALPLMTGNTPGMPRSTAQAWLFGGAPYSVAAAENSLLRVASRAWISKPITLSHLLAALIRRTPAAYADANPSVVDNGGRH